MKSPYLFILLPVLLMSGCTDTKTAPPDQAEQVAQQEDSTSKEAITNNDTDQNTEQAADAVSPPQSKDTISTSKDAFKGYKKIEVDGGDLTGSRQANVVVDIGFGDRKYWAFTNEHGQLIRVIAKKIVLQDDATEYVTRDGRYYSDEAKVPGVERADLDEGHIIADSLGGYRTLFEQNL